jgi:hypothetical protein
MEPSGLPRLVARRSAVLLLPSGWVERWQARCML